MSTDEKCACLVAFLDALLFEILSPPDSDPIKLCPISARVLLETRPSAVIDLSHAKIHSFPFSEVPLSWRRLYTDASIAEAIRLTKENLKSTESFDAPSHHGSQPGELSHDWIGQTVRLLDMAIIMCGAPDREDSIAAFFSELQEYLDNKDDASLRPVKRRRITHQQEINKIFPDALPKIQKPVQITNSMSMSQFQKHLPSAQPMLVKNALSHWPAFFERPWKSPDYLLSRTFGGRRLVPIELGRSYTDEGWGQTILTFREFLDRFIIDDEPGQVAVEQVKPALVYLAQHDLFAQISSLRDDISIPDFCYTDPPPPAEGTPLASKTDSVGKLEEPLLNAWFGPKGTVSPLHTDPYHNILCQVVGQKYVRLYSPHESSKLYPRGTGEGGVDMSNTSQVDIEADAADLEGAFPHFKDADYLETILDEGECLYIPVGWWHYIRSLSVSFSVSFWWN